MAVQTVMLVATYFGAQEIAWSSKAESTTGLIICINHSISSCSRRSSSRASEKIW
jgi:UMF1 family MFS transporter